MISIGTINGIPYYLPQAYEVEFGKSLYADPYIYIKIPAKIGDQRKDTFGTYLVRMLKK